MGGEGEFKLTWIRGKGVTENEEENTIVVHHAYGQEGAGFGYGMSKQICDPFWKEDITCLELDLLLDKYPEDVTWELIGPGGLFIMNGDYKGLGCFEPKEETCYKFRIFDKYGDGLCCNQGNGGGYKVLWH